MPELIEGTARLAEESFDHSDGTPATWIEHRRVDKQCAALPLEILKRYEKWKDIAAISAPPGLRRHHAQDNCRRPE